MGLLARNCIKGCDHTSPNTEEETSTFMIYTRAPTLERDIACLSKKFHPPELDKDCVDSMLERMKENGTCRPDPSLPNPKKYPKSLLTFF